METNFTDAQRQRPAIQEADSILRKCVHCGFCTATCPTYVLLGDELDSPRGRIYLIKDMLEKDKPASPKVVKHIDRCLTCLSCMTTCPSGVDYMHLVDQAREHIDKTYVRPLPERALRTVLRRVLPYTGRFRALMALARLGRPFAALAPGRLAGLLEKAPGPLPKAGAENRPGVFAAQGPRKMRVAMLTGCVQPALSPEINEATVRLLTRLGAEVVVPKGQGCCGALSHHMGSVAEARAFARANIDAWLAEGDLDAVVVNASGCGVTVKDYGHLLAEEPAYAEKAARISGLAKDLSEVLRDLDPEWREVTRPIAVAWHPPCSLQHGQKLRDVPKGMLEAAGYHVSLPAEAHLCCGSAGTYSMMQPELSSKLQARRTASLERLQPDVVATANIGCLHHIGEATHLPVVHYVELLDWATGGPRPRGMP